MQSRESKVQACWSGSENAERGRVTPGIAQDAHFFDGAVPTLGGPVVTYLLPLRRTSLLMLSQPGIAPPADDTDAWTFSAHVQRAPRPTLFRLNTRNARKGAKARRGRNVHLESWPFKRARLDEVENVPL